jgi:mono/diheme cytochrome c family protein
VAFLAAVAGLSLIGRPTLAQGPPDKAVPLDGYQRSADHYVFKATAKSGPQRGEELYYYKCWFCHNQFAKRAPYLKDMFKRQGVTDQTVAEKIRKGGPGMPSYGTMLGDAAITDLLAYLKERCCWEGEDAPPNPRYILEKR